MSEVDRLFRDYLRRERAGEDPDPLDYVSKLEGVDRRELETLIDGHLRRAPARSWDAEAFRRSGAARIADSMTRSLQGASGLWPSVLPRLRDEAQVTRQGLVSRLASALGVEGREEKVHAYYHEMEQGRLPADGVSDRALDALGVIVGRSGEWLRRAGEAIAPGPGQAEAAAFARTADRAVGQERPAAAPARGPEAPEWDEVDELFRGRAREG